MSTQHSTKKILRPHSYSILFSDEEMDKFVELSIDCRMKRAKLIRYLIEQEIEKYSNGAETPLGISMRNFEEAQRQKRNSGSKNHLQE